MLTGESGSIRKGLAAAAAGCFSGGGFSKSKLLAQERIPIPHSVLSSPAPANLENSEGFRRLVGVLVRVGKQMGKLV